MKIIIFLSLFLSMKFTYSQECNDFKVGIFKSNSEYGTVIIERKGIFQLERALNFAAVYLQKIEVINECEYIVSRYKIISLGKLPEPDMNDKARVEITNIEDNVFYIKAELLETPLVINDKYTKVSNEISDEFKKILLNEEVNNITD